MLEIKLKPCPFCGGKVVATARNLGAEWIYFIKCNKCGAVISFNNSACNNFPAKAIECWNRRAENDC